jgi:hypothetical protein
MKIIAKIGLAVWLLPLLLSGCASHTKCKTLIPVATYKLSDRENVERVGYQTLWALRIICGAIVDENTGECWIVVDPDKVGRAKKILRSTLSCMNPEQRERAFKVLDYETAQPDGAAHRSQPVRSETNQPSAAASSGR